MLAARFPVLLFINGLLLIILGLVMVVPALVDLAYGHADWRVFAISSCATGFVGLLLALAFRRPDNRLDPHQGFLLTVSAWLSVSLFGALPLILCSLQPSLTDALFETVSGLTTTGATVFAGLDGLPPGILLWRSLLQWLGGIGIVAMALVLLPMLRVGGMQLFRSESSEIGEKHLPRLSQVVGVTALAYAGLTLACVVGLLLAGMGPFDAVNHAMAAIATGGFSTKDASVGHFDSVAVEGVLIAGMLAGALPLIFYANLILRGRRALAEERQVPAFLAIWAVAVGLMTLWTWHAMDWEPAHALRLSAFNVTSILTDTGFATADFSTWGSFAVGLFFTLYFVGGCAGSTAGAIKVFRWQILLRSTVFQLRRMLSPNRVLTLRYGRDPVDSDMLASVRTFFFMYLATFCVLSLALMAMEMDYLSATSAVAQAMAAAGPGLGPEVGPATNFGGIPEGAKWVLMLAMLLGRLELSTVYVLLIPDFWRR